MMLTLIALMFFNGQDLDTGQLRVDYVERVTLVRLPLKVMRSGEPYRRLKLDQVSLVENGISVTPTALQEVETPLVIHFLFDLSSSNDREILTAKRAARDIINRMKPGDKAKISFFSAGYQSLTDYTEDKERLHSRIGLLSAAGSTALYDSISISVRELTRQSGNRVVVLFSDGHDFMSRTSEEELMAEVRNYRIPILFAAFSKKRQSASLLKAQFKFMVDMVKASGGESVTRPSEMSRELLRGLKEMRKRYLVSFTPPDPSDTDQWRSLVVRVGACPECKLEYRRGYRIGN